MHACGCVLAYAEKRLTILITYTHPDQSTQAHLRGQHPMTASEPPAKWVADSRVDDDVVCRVEEGRAAAARRRRRNQGKEEWNKQSKAGSGAAKQTNKTHQDQCFGIFCFQQEQD